MLKRRDFIAGAAGFLPFSRALALPDEPPVMRLGVMTDTHVGKTVESCGRLRMALELFKARGAELIINNGDIADHFYPTGYEAYRKVSDEVYGADYRPQEIFTYAWHDAFDYKNHARDQVTKDAPVAFEEVRRLLQAPNGHTAEVRFKGYTFLVMPQFTGASGFLSWDEYEARVAAACRENPGKPVFVVDHVPPLGTVYNSYAWGSGAARKVLSNYPQVVAFTGHVHGSLRNDLFIWQKEFTVINSGCLQVWNGILAANGVSSKEAFGVLTVDVYPDRLLVRRWDVRDKSEIDPDHPWTVPLPFVAATAPYERTRRAAAEPKPRFAANAAVSAEAEGSPFKGFRISFPEVGEHAMLYRIGAEKRGLDGRWGEFAWIEMFSDYWKHPKDRTGRAEFLYRAPYFEPGREYRFSVAPVNQYGVKGDPIFAEAKSPAKFAGAVVVYETDSPMDDLEFCASLDAPPMKAEGGFYGPVKGLWTWLKLPKGLFAGPKGTKFRAVLDMRTLQPDEGLSFAVKLQDPALPPTRRSTVQAPLGDSGAERYVMELDKQSEADTYYICFRGGAGGRVKLNHLRIESENAV